MKPKMLYFVEILYLATMTKHLRVFGIKLYENMRLFHFLTILVDYIGLFCRDASTQAARWWRQHLALSSPHDPGSGNQLSQKTISLKETTSCLSHKTIE
jgi:hypothetical protein